MLNKKKLYTLNNGFMVIEYIDKSGYKLRALASADAIYSDTMTGNYKYELYYPYIKLYDLPNRVKSNINSTLVLGAGCLTYPKYYISHYNNKELDAIEIDSEIIHVAFKYFYVDDLYQEFDKDKKRLNIINTDAMDYVEKCNKKYDYIFNDVFDDNEPSEKFLSYNFLDKVKCILNDDGIYSTNYIINEGKKIKFDNYISRLRNYFKYIFLISINDKNVFDNELGNIYIMASNQELIIPKNDNIVLLNEILL